MRSEPVVSRTGAPGWACSPTPAPTLLIRTFPGANVTSCGPTFPVCFTSWDFCQRFTAAEVSSVYSSSGVKPV